MRGMGVFMFPAGRHGLLSIMDRHLTIELVTFSIDKKKRGEMSKQEEKVSVEEVTEQIKKFLKSDPSVPTKDLVKRLQDTGFNQKELYQLIIKLKTSLLH